MPTPPEVDCQTLGSYLGWGLVPAEPGHPDCVYAVIGVEGWDGQGWIDRCAVAIG